MNKKTIICRCEDVTQEEIRKLIAEGYTTAEEIKKISRCGMGPCQGRTCRSLLIGELARATGREVGEIKVTTFRPPVRPVKLGVFLAEGGADGTDEKKNPGGEAR